MTFVSPFRAPVSSPFPSQAVSAVSWWLSGGVTAGQCVAAYQPKGAASYAASKTNLNNPGTYNSGDGLAIPTWDATNGWKFNSTDQYLTTGITINANWSVICRFSGASTATAVLFGQFDNVTGNFCRILPNWTSGIQYGNGQNVVNVATGITSGVLAVAGTNGYRNGNLDTSSLSAWVGGGGSYSMYIGVQNWSTLLFYYGGYIQALAVYNVVLSAPQVLAITTAMQAL